AVLPVQARAVDRLGSPVSGAVLSFAMADPSVASVDVSGNVHALANGTTTATVANGTVTTAVVVRVTQRPVRVVPASDTVRFAALGETRSVSAIALDSLGFQVPGGVTDVSPTDTTVGQQVDSATVRAARN